MEKEGKSSTVRKLLIGIGGASVINAVYIFGQSYYQGFLYALGFDYALFPISRFESFESAYNASLNLSVDIYTFSKGIFIRLFLLIVFSVFVLSLFWYSFQPNELLEDRLKEFFSDLKNDHPKIYKFVERFLFSERLSKSFQLTAIAWQTINVTALVVLLWFFFPFVGLNYGEKVANDRMQTFEDDLCSRPKNQWDWCLRIKHGDELIVGRLMLNHEGFLGIYTTDGPIVISRPDPMYITRNGLSSE